MRIAILCLTFALLALVLCAVVWVMNAAGPETGDAGPAAAPLVGEVQDDLPVVEETTAGEAAGPDRVIAYYFHWTNRCVTCLEIEQCAHDAIHEILADDVAAGRLEWHAHDMEQPAYAHFQQDFELSTPSLVLVRIEGGAIAQWKVLERTWDLVEMPWSLRDYVITEAREYLTLAFGED